MSIAIGRYAAALGCLLFMTLGALSPAYAQEDTAAVRLVHAVPDGPPVDVYIDGVSVAEGVGFFTVGDYFAVPSGARLVQVTAADTPPSSAVISETLSLAAGQPYTLLASGTADSIEASLLEDDRTLPAAGDTKIRFIHAVADGPAVDIRRVGADVPLINNLAFQEASDYLPLLPGSYDLNVVATGETAELFDFDQTLVADEPIYDIFLIGTLSDMRAEVVSPAARPAAAQPTPEPTATTAPAQPSAETATAQPMATAAQPTAAPSPTTQAPSQLPTTSGRSGSPLVLIVAATLLIAGGLLVSRRSRTG